MSDRDLLESLRHENDQLRAQLSKSETECERYRKALEKMLREQEIDIDMDEIAAMRAHPEQYQTMDEFMSQLRAELGK